MEVVISPIFLRSSTFLPFMVSPLRILYLVVYLKKNTGAALRLLCDDHLVQLRTC